MRKVETLPTGRFKVRFRHRGSQTSETFDDRAEAVRFNKWLEALGPQGALDLLYAEEQRANIPTMDQIAAEHIDHLTGIEDGTRKTYRRLWLRTWGPQLGHVQADRLTRDDIARAVNELGKTYSRKSLENQRGLLSAVVGRAVDQGWLTKNHAKGIRLPRGKEADRADMVILTPDEFADIVAKVPENYRPLVRFLAGTGCRWGEAVALQVGDLDLAHRAGGRAQPLVRFRRALKWSPDGDRVVGPTKTKKSNRTIVLPPELLPEIAELIADRGRTELVFTAPRGGAVLHRTFWSRVWLPAVSGVEPRPRIHDLRHSHASWLLAQGVPIHVVQARLGHESIQTTVDTYSHLLPDAQAMAANAASVAFTPRPALG